MLKVTRVFLVAFCMCKTPRIKWGSKKLSDENIDKFGIIKYY